MLARSAKCCTRSASSDFVIRLNHRRAAAALLDGAGVPAGRKATRSWRSTSSTRSAATGCEQELAARGIADDGSDRACLDAFDGRRRRPSSWTRHARRASDGRRVAGVDESAEIVALSGARRRAGACGIDPSLARGLSYYTGAIMEIAVPDLAGSLGGGGRYDNLVGMFLGRDVPACGFSLGLERIIVVMTERRMFPGPVAAAASTSW